MIGGTGDLLHGITMLGETSQGHGGPRITKFRAMSQVRNSSITPKSPPGWVKTFKLKTYMYIYIYNACMGDEHQFAIISQLF